MSSRRKANRMRGGAKFSPQDQMFAEALDSYEREKMAKARAAQQRLRRPRSSGSPQYDRLQAEKDAAYKKRVKAGEVEDDYLYEDSTRCPDGVGTDMNQQPFTETDEFGYQRATRLANKMGLADYHKVKDPVSGKMKPLRTKDGKWCVRGVTEEVTKESIQLGAVNVLKRLKEINNLLQVGLEEEIKKVSKKSGLGADALRMSKLMQNLQYQKQYGPGAIFQPSGNDMCDPSGESAAVQKKWTDVAGTPAKPTRLGLRTSQYEKDSGKWSKGWYIPIGKDRVMCVDDDSNLAERMQPVAHHHREELRQVPDEEKPQWRTGVKQPDAKTYQEAAFCAQQLTKGNCESPDPVQKPLGGKGAPANSCQWYESEYGIGESMCQPNKIRSDAELASTGSEKLAYAPNNAFAQWYDLFKTEEQRLLNSRGFNGMGPVPGMETSRMKLNNRFTGETAAAGAWKKMSGAAASR